MITMKYHVESNFMRYKRYYSCRFILALGLSAVTFWQSACSRVKVAVEPKVAEYFEEISEPTHAQVKSNIQQDEPWWHSLNDAQLNLLIDGLFTHNLQLKQATERITQVRAIAVQAGSQRWPSVSLDLGWSRTKQLNPFARLARSSTSSATGTPGMTSSMGTPSSAMPESFTQDNFRASLAVSYELDVWGRIGSLTQAAELDVVATESDLKSMAITLSASAVDIYLQLIEAQVRLEVLQEQLKDDEDQLQVVKTRYQQGISPQIEVLQLTQQRDRTRSQLPPMHAMISQLKRSLAALRGESKLSQLLIPNRLPLKPDLPSLGIPASILENRPDIQSAMARLKAADARVSAAVSSRLPALRFGTNAGYQSFEMSELFDDFIWSLSSSLFTPLFQGGRLKAEQARTEAVLRERLHAVHERYLTAYHEIENALANERSLSEQFERIKEQYNSAQILFKSARNRYLQGVGDFLTMLNARQGLFASRLAMLTAERSALSARVQLHRACGGDWLKSLALQGKSEE
ncbi:MAG: hypothetical protein CMH49_04075 [Myxococcales bacterium]|nr:hypothetical protein [Myxococcales bacterium]